MAKKTASKAAPKPAKIVPATKVRKKSELYTLLAEHNGLARKQVAGVFETLGRVMAADLAKPSPSGPRVFQIPGLLKVSSIHKPATKATQKANPFKPGEMMTVKAKPARTVVKVRALKGLKSMV